MAREYFLESFAYAPHGFDNLAALICCISQQPDNFPESSSVLLE